MSKVVLIVEPDAAVRAALGTAFSARGVSFAEAVNMSQGIAALGSADFGALIVQEGVRVSLRGLCRLARKRHPAIHVLIRLAPTSKAQDVSQVVGILVNTCAHTSTADETADMASTGMSVPTPFDFAPLSTQLVEADVRAALDAELAAGALDLETDDGDVFSGLEGEDSFASSPTPAPAPAAPVIDDTPLLEGSLEEDTGAALLMSLFAQDLTGILKVDDGPAKGTITFQRGEPIWADVSTGWKELLMERGALAVDAKVPKAKDEELLGALVAAQAVAQDAAQKVLNDVTRERVVALARQTAGTWSFVERTGFPAGMIAAKANPFGLIMDSMRRSMAPNQLFGAASEMEGHFVVPGPALSRAAQKLMTFTRGVDVSQLIDGTTTAQDFQKSTGLDMLMGTLVLLVLRECRLVSLQDAPLEMQANQVEIQLVPHEGDDEPEELETIQSAFDLCVQLMGAGDADTILGLARNASAAAVDAAFKRRMRELETPPGDSGSAQQLLQWRLGMLRERVQKAYDKRRRA